MKKKKAPRLETDKKAEAFLAQDLSALDFSQFKPERFEFEKNDQKRQYDKQVAGKVGKADPSRAKARS